LRVFIGVQVGVEFPPSDWFFDLSRTATIETATFEGLQELGEAALEPSTVAGLSASQPVRTHLQVSLLSRMLHS